MRNLFFLFLLLVLALGARASEPAVALYYGDTIPTSEFGVFDITVVDPDHSASGGEIQPGARFYAYVSVGEVQASRPYYRDIPDAWKLTRNPDWRSEVIDQSTPGWADFLASRVVQPLWDRGYRGFFLDTLDSYQLAPDVNQQAQEQGLVRVVETLHQRFPGIRLILNRGFEIIDRVADKVDMVAAESLYRGWNASAGRYDPVSPSDREWLEQQLRAVQQRYRLPVLVIDYVDPADRTLTRQTADAIRKDGFIPWVTDADLSTMGIGSIEVVPRHILVLYNGAQAGALNYSGAHYDLQMPINYLGYVADYVDVSGPLPEAILGDRYAGVVLWMSGTIQPQQQTRLARWLKARLDERRLPVAIMGDWGVPVSGGLARSMGISLGKNEEQAGLHRTRVDSMLGFEAAPPRTDTGSTLVQLAPQMREAARPLVEFAQPDGGKLVGGAIMPWGGFVINPYVLEGVPGAADLERWVVDPFAFLKQALRLSDFPIPDTTTENGRRLLTAHVDGDGFPSLAELPGSPMASEVLLDQILRKYRIPQTMSVIEGEVAPDGLYPELSPRMESIAKKMFALPWVEIGTHTFSHPFFLNPVGRERALEKDPAVELMLPVPDYQLDIAREVVGSTRYINERLAPAGKSVKILQWPGDTAPDTQWLKAVYQAGLLNINGGDTYITRANPSLTAVGPLGIRQDGYLQIYAPVTNENIYTNDWQGPYYAYEQAIESFELTDAPRRIKPVGIYYHVYAASKAASLRALHKVYDWAMARPLHPVHVTDFVWKVEDFYRFSVARGTDGWRLHGQGNLRTVRLPAALGTPDLSASRGVAGWRAGVAGTYVHLTGSDALLATGGTDAPMPYLFDANAKLADWQTSDGGRHLTVDFQGYVPLEFALANTRGCRVSVKDRPLSPLRGRAGIPSTVQSFRLADSNAHVDIDCTAR